MAICLACMLLHVAITLFSPAHPHAHFMFLLSLQTLSLDASLEKCHTLPIIIHYTVFIISHVSTVLWYHSVPKLSFYPPHTQSPLVFHFVFLSMGFSHTPYMSLDMNPTVGDRSRNLKFSTYHQDQSMESSSNEIEGSASTYPCRSRAEAFKRTGLMES